MPIRGAFVFFLSIIVLLVSAVASAQTRPPVMLVDGWYNCNTGVFTDPTTSFGQLQRLLEGEGISVYYFRPCSAANPRLPNRKPLPAISSGGV
jgi:hypothetical protein